MQTAFETYFNSLKGKKIAVLGLGVSNRPLVRLLLEFGCDVLGCDRTPREKLDAEVLQLEEMGRGERNPDSIPYLFGGKRAEAGFLAPAQGLCLLEVEY